MEALRETTDWDVEYRQPNHIYLFDGSKAIAYIKWGEGAPEFFKKPMAIDRRSRRFEPANINLFNLKKEKSNAITITGSKGQQYTIDPQARSCTCPGYTYRGTCRHLAEYV